MPQTSPKQRRTRTASTASTAKLNSTAPTSHVHPLTQSQRVISEKTGSTWNTFSAGMMKDSACAKEEEPPRLHRLYPSRRRQLPHSASICRSGRAGHSAGSLRNDTEANVGALSHSSKKDQRNSNNNNNTRTTEFVTALSPSSTAVVSSHMENVGPSSGLTPSTTAATTSSFSISSDPQQPPPHTSSPSMLLELPCMQRLSGHTTDGKTAVVTATTLADATAGESSQRSCASSLINLAALQTSQSSSPFSFASSSSLSSFATSPSHPPAVVKPADSRVRFTAPHSPAPRTAVDMVDILSATHGRRRRHMANTSFIKCDGKREEEGEEQQLMVRHVTGPLMFLPAMQSCRMRRVSSSEATDASPPDGEVLSTSLTATAAAAATTSNLTCSDFTLSPTALLRRSTAIAVRSDNVLDGSTAVRRTNTMSTLPTQLQQQRQREKQQKQRNQYTTHQTLSPAHSLLIDSPQSSKKNLPKARLSTTAADVSLPSASTVVSGSTTPSPIIRTEEELAATTAPVLTAKSSGQRPERTARQLQFPDREATVEEHHDGAQETVVGHAEQLSSCRGDSAEHFRPTTNATTLDNDTKAVLPPLLSLIPSLISVTTSPMQWKSTTTMTTNRKEKRATAAMSTGGGNSPLLVDPPYTALQHRVLLPSQPHRSNGHQCGPTADTTLSESEDGMHGFHVEEELQELMSCTSTSNNRHARQQQRRSRERKKGSANNGEKKNREELPIDVSKVTPSKPTGSSPALLQVSCDASADVFTTGASVVSSTCLSSASSVVLSQATPMSTRKAERRAAPRPVEMTWKQLSQTLAPSVSAATQTIHAAAADAEAAHLPSVSAHAGIPSSSFPPPFSKTGGNQHQTLGSTNSRNDEDSLKSMEAPLNRYAIQQVAKRQRWLSHGSTRNPQSPPPSAGPSPCTSTQFASPTAPSPLSLPKTADASPSGLRYPSLSEDSINSPSPIRQSLGSCKSRGKVNESASEKALRVSGEQCVHADKQSCSTEADMRAPSASSSLAAAAMAPTIDRCRYPTTPAIQSTDRIRSHTSSSFAAPSHSVSSSGLPLPSGVHTSMSNTALLIPSATHPQQQQQQHSPTFLVCVQQHLSLPPHAAPIIPSPPRWPSRIYTSPKHKSATAACNVTDSPDTDGAGSLNSFLNSTTAAAGGGQEKTAEAVMKTATTFLTCNGPARIPASREDTSKMPSHGFASRELRSVDPTETTSQPSNVMSAEESFRGFVGGVEAHEQQQHDHSDNNSRVQAVVSLPLELGRVLFTAPTSKQTNTKTNSHSYVASPLPRGSNVNGSRGTSPTPFHSVAGLASGASSLLRSTEAASRPSSVFAINNSSTPHFPPPGAATPSITVTSAHNIMAGGGWTPSTPASSNVLHTSARSLHRASPVFTGFVFAAHNNNSNMSATTTETPHVVSNRGSPSAPPTTTLQSLTATSQLLARRSAGSVSSTSSIGAFVLQGSGTTAIMMRRGAPHQLMEVSLPNNGNSSSGGHQNDKQRHHEGSGSNMATTATTTGGEESGTFEDDDDDLMSSTTHRANRRAFKLSRKSTQAGAKRMSSSRRGRSLLKPGTAIELALLNGEHVRRPSTVSLCNYNNSGGGAGRWGTSSAKGRSGIHSDAIQRSWGNGEPMEISLSCAASFTASFTSASETYVSSSYGSVSQVIVRYGRHLELDEWAEEKKSVHDNKNTNTNKNSSTHNNALATRLHHDASRTAVPSRSLSPNTVVDNAEVTYEREKGKGEGHTSSEVPCELYASAPRHYHFYRTAPRGAAQQQRHQLEKRHHRYVRVHHRRRNRSAPMPSKNDRQRAPPPPVPASPEQEATAAVLNVQCTSLHEPPPSDEANRGTLKGEEMIASLAPPPTGTFTVPRISSPLSTRPASIQPIYSPHLSTSSLLYYDDVDSDAVDDVYYQLEKRLFPIKAEEELRRRVSMVHRPAASLLETKDAHHRPNGTDDDDDDGRTNMESNEPIDSLFNVLDVPLRLNLRGGFHLSDYYAPCPVCHPVMRKLSAAAMASSSSTSSDSSTIDNAKDSVKNGGSADSDAGDDNRFCSCTSSCLTCSSDDESTPSNARCSSSSRASSCSGEKSLVSSPNASSSTTDTAASSPSAASALSSVISATGVGFAFGSGARLTSVVPPPSQRFATYNSGAGGTQTIVEAAATINTVGIPPLNSKSSLESGSANAVAPQPSRAHSNNCHMHRSSPRVFAPAAAVKAGSKHSSHATKDNNSTKIISGGWSRGARSRRGCQNMGAAVLSPGSAEDDLVSVVPSPPSISGIPSAPSRYQTGGNDGTRQTRAEAEQLTSAPSTLIATTTAATTTAADRNSNTVGRTLSTGHTFSSILQQRGAPTVRAALTDTSLPQPVFQVSTQQQRHPTPTRMQFPSVPSLTPLSHGQYPPTNSASHSTRNSQGTLFSPAMAVLSAIRESRSLTVDASMLTRHLARYRRIRQRHRPALVVARRHGYLTGAALHSQGSSLMMQHLLCVRINDKYTYIDPKRLTGAAKLVMGAALMAERKKRHEEKRLRAHKDDENNNEKEKTQKEKSSAGVRDAVDGTREGDDKKEKQQEQQPVQKYRPTVAQGSPGGTCCRHCHRFRKPHSHHEGSSHHHPQRLSPSQYRNRQQRRTIANMKDGRIITSSSPHHHHHHRKKDADTDHSSDLLSQNVSERWDLHGAAFTPRGRSAAAGIGTPAATERSAHDEHAHSGCGVFETPKMQPQSHPRHIFGDGLACFAAQKSPAPRGPNPPRNSTGGGTLTFALRRPDGASPSKSSMMHCLVIGNESRPPSQRSTFVSRTTGPIVHRVQSSPSFYSPEGNRSPVTVVAPSSLHGSIHITIARERSGSGSDVSETVNDKQGESTQGVVPSSDHVSFAEYSTATSPQQARSARKSTAVPAVLKSNSTFETVQHTPSMVRQRSDSTLLSTYANGDQLMTVDSTHMSDVEPESGVVGEPGDRSGRGRRKRPPSTGSYPVRGGGGSSSNVNTRLTYRREGREGSRAGPTPMADMADMPPYSFSSHNFPLHLFDSGYSSSGLSPPPPSCLSNVHHSHNSTCATVKVAAVPSMEGEEERQGSRYVQRSAAFSTVTPLVSLGAQSSALCNLSSRSTSPSGLLNLPLTHNTSTTPHTYEHHSHHQPRRHRRGSSSHSHCSHSQQRHSSSWRGRMWTSTSDRHRHRRGYPLLSSPPDAAVNEEDLLNTALAAYPEFSVRPDPSGQPWHPQPQ